MPWFDSCPAFEVSKSFIIRKLPVNTLFAHISYRVHFPISRSTSGERVKVVLMRNHGDQLLSLCLLVTVSRWKREGWGDAQGPRAYSFVLYMPFWEQSRGVSSDTMTRELMMMMIYFPLVSGRKAFQNLLPLLHSSLLPSTRSLLYMVQC